MSASLPPSPPYALRRGLSLNLGLLTLASLAGQQTPGALRFVSQELGLQVCAAVRFSCLSSAGMLACFPKVLLC